MRRFEYSVLEGPGSLEIRLSESPAMRGPTEWTGPTIHTADAIAKAILTQPMVRVVEGVRQYAAASALPEGWTFL